THGRDAIALAQCALARAWQARRRYPEAEKAWRVALRLWEGEAPQGLAVAGVYHGLGVLFWEQGLPNEAETHFRRALDLRQTQATGGLELATSLHYIGLVAASRADFD